MEELFNDHGWHLTLEEAKLPDGRVKKIARAERADVVSIIAYTDSGKILILREYRPFYGTYVWMLPTGKVDKENDIAVAAQRELREETGFRAKNITYLWGSKYAEALKATNHVFLASDLVKDPLPQDAHEMIEVHEFSLEEAVDKVCEGECVHMGSAYALLRHAKEQK